MVTYSKWNKNVTLGAEIRTHDLQTQVALHYGCFGHFKILPFW